MTENNSWICNSYVDQRLGMSVVLYGCGPMEPFPTYPEVFPDIYPKTTPAPIVIPQITKIYEKNIKKECKDRLANANKEIKNISSEISRLRELLEAIEAEKETLEKMIEATK
jgi:hypothetical protein